MTSSGDLTGCVVLLRNLGQGMLHEIVAAVVNRQSDVVVYEECLPEGVAADLLIERDDEVGSVGTPTLLVSGEGRAVLAVPIAQVSEAALLLTVSSVVALKHMESASG